jgi:4-amino-4-deoxy-L-arabinose transferase-like glycosyltransferase
MKREHNIQFPEIPLWLVWGIVCYFVSFKLGSYPILDNNEGLYAEIPREMLRSGDWHQWIIPHLNGLPYMEKPPLLYWLTAVFLRYLVSQSGLPGWFRCSLVLDAWD